MATTTARDLISIALQMIRGDNPGETSSAPDINSAFDTLNLMMDSFAGRSLLTLAVVPESFALVSGLSSYNIGVGQISPNVNSSTPFSIESAYLQDDQLSKYPLEIVNRDVFNSYLNRDVVGEDGIPQSLFYDPGLTQQAVRRGTINIWPKPDSSMTYTLYIFSEKPFTEFSTLNDVITFPPSYKEFILYNLAKRLATYYGLPIPQEVQELALETTRIIQNINSRNKRIIASFTMPGLKGSVYNILTGTYQ